MEYISPILISGMPGSGKSSLAKIVAAFYNFEVYSIGSIFRKTHKEKYPNNEVSFEDYWKSTSLEDNRQADIIASKRMQEGKVIGDFRYANSRTFQLSPFKIFVNCDLETRAKRAMSGDFYNNKSLEEIKNILIKREQDEIETGKKLYGNNYSYKNSEDYILILNSGLLTLNQELEIVKAAYESIKK